MKALSKKSLILVLSLVLALSALMFAFSFKPVKAATGTSVGTWSVMEAAQVRRDFDGKGAGLRFRVQMDYQTASYVKANDDVTMGFIITPHYYFENRAGETVAEGETATYGADDYIKSIEKYVNKDAGGIIVDESTIYVADTQDNIKTWEKENTEDITSANESYYVNGAVVEIKVANRDLDFTVIAYIKNADGTYSYAVPSASFARNVYDTANTAYWDKEEVRYSIEKAFDWYATESYPIKINDKAQYDEFALSTATDKFEGNHLQIAAPIDLGKGDGSELKVVSKNFAGTLSVASDATLVYENEAQVGVAPALAEEDCVAKDVLDSTIEVYDPDKLNIKPADIDKLYYRSSIGGRYVSLDATYMSAEEVTAYNTQNNIVNNHKIYEKTYGYAEYDAIKFDAPNTNNNYYAVDTHYSGEAYKLFAQKGKFNAVAFEFMIKTDETVTTVKNNVAGYATLASAIGYYSSSYLAALELDIPTNTWITGFASVDKVASSISDDKLVAFRPVGADGLTYYMSEIKFITYDYLDSYITYREEYVDYNIIPAEEDLGILSDNMSKSDYETAYLSADDVAALTTVDNSMDYSKTAYEWKAFGYNTALRVEMPYTETEYKKMADLKNFNAVKFTYAIENAEKTTFRQSALESTAHPTLLSASYGAPKAISANVWTPYVLSISDFLTAMDGNTLYVARHLDTDRKTVNVYLGEIEFITFDFDKDVLDKGSKLFIAASGKESDFRQPQNYGWSYTYVGAEDLAKLEGVDNPLGYDGAAVAAGPLVNNNWLQVKNSAYRYDVSELTKLLDNGTYTHIRISYLATGTVGYKSNQGGVLVDAGVSLVANKWTEADIPIQVLLDEIGTGTYSSWFRAALEANFMFYFGDMKLVKVTTVS